MPEIQAFRGIRYDLGHVGSLGDVIAPPYDVISPEFQKELYEKHPCNVVRLILNRREPEDDEANNGYTRAARYLKNWQAQGVLFREADPAIYVYHQQFDIEGATYTRRGFMARMRLSRFGQGKVFPHEQTMKGPKIDRLMLTAVCKTNLSQIFGLYPDANNQAQQLLEDAIVGATPVEATDHLDVVHRLWPVTDVAVIGAVASVMESKPLFVADGHHRYETACDYLDQLRDGGGVDVNHPANFVLTMCVAMEDPGLIVQAAHRLFKGVPDITSEELTAKLGDLFTVRVVGEGPEAASTVWEDMATIDRQDTMALYARGDRKWLIVALTDAGRLKMAEVASDHGEQWRELGYAILHRLILESLLELRDLPKPRCVQLGSQMADALAGDEFPLAAMVMPATIDHVRDISLSGERMPAKSTYFYPKLLSGLVLNRLE